jgi:hypothetical protein
MRFSFAIGSTLAVGLLLTQASNVCAAPLAATSLNPGVCPSVSQNTLLQLEWNPGFDHPETVRRIEAFSLVFAKAGEDAMVLHSHTGLRLEARSQRDDPNSDITAEANGFYAIRFLANLQSIDPGVYHLVDSDAYVVPVAGHQGELPHMTNSPVHSAFCLNVLSPSPRPGR